MKMTVPRKLLAGFSGTAVILAAVSAFSYVELKQIDSSYTQLLAVPVQIQFDVSEM